MLRISLSLSIVCSLSSFAAAEAPIVGGTTVPKGRWPDVVAVMLRDGVCSGTLIAPDVVLTAGHCIDGDPVEVIVDTVDYAGPGGDRIPVAWSRAYPDWQSRYDVGVVVLARAAAVPPRAIAATCTARDALVGGRDVHLVGFGLATYAGTDSNTRLRTAKVPVTDPTCTLDPACQPSIAPDGEFMAGGQGADSCFGDSGGPVYLDTPIGPVLVGVVSRGLSLPAAPCGGGGVYVRADRVASWIQKVTDRRLERTSCSGRSDEASTEEGTGGCSAGSEVGLGLGLAVYGLMRWSRRGRRIARDRRHSASA